MEIISYITFNGFSPYKDIATYLIFTLIPLSIAYILIKDKKFNLILEEVNKSNATPLIHRVNYYFFCPLLIFIIAISIHKDYSIDMFHHGELITPLYMHMQGKEFYSEIYFQHGLLKNFGIAFFSFLMLPNTVVSVIYLNAILSSFSYLILYSSGIKILNNHKFLSFICVLLVLSHIKLDFKHTLSLLVFYLLLNVVESCSNNLRVKILTILASFFTVMSFWYSKDFAFYSFISFLLSVFICLNLKDAFRVSIYFLLSFIFINLLPALILIKYNLILDFLTNFTKQIFYHSYVWGLPLSTPNFSHFFSSRENLFWLSITSYSLIGIFILFIKLNTKKCKNKYFDFFTVSYIFSYVFFHTALVRSDFAHWESASFLFYLLILIIILMPDYVISFTKKLSFLRYGIISLLVIFIFYKSNLISYRFNILNNRDSRMKNLVEIDKLGRTVLNSDNFEEIVQTISLIKKITSPNDYIYDFSNQPLYYYLADRKVPTKYFLTSYAFSKELENNVITSLRSKKPKIIISNINNFHSQLDGVSLKERHPEIYSYIRSNYTIKQRVYSNLIWISNS